MQISNSAYMGVEVLVRLVAYEPDRCCTAQALAEWINRSMSSTETLMSRLRAAGLVRATRGPAGGYHLNKPADKITVAEIFMAFDEPHVLNRGRSTRLRWSRKQSKTFMAQTCSGRGSRATSCAS